jgi:imidazole glycerol-phosphate synthase subunit HisH
VARIGIVDYGMGNLRSVAGAVEKVGHAPVISFDPTELAACDKLILPGVGAFPDAMASLSARGLVAALEAMVRADKKPILGICLGAQLLARSSTEFVLTRGLGWVDAPVERVADPDEPDLLVPHVGWNRVTARRDCVLFQDVPDDALFYYVHSYRIGLDDRDAVVGQCVYGPAFASVLARGNVYGTQFHPEKSQRHGLRLLANFIERG